MNQPSPRVAQRPVQEWRCASRASGSRHPFVGQELRRYRMTLDCVHAAPSAGGYSNQYLYFWSWETDLMAEVAGCVCATDGATGPRWRSATSETDTCRSGKCLQRSWRADLERHAAARTLSTNRPRSTPALCPAAWCDDGANVEPAATGCGVRCASQGSRYRPARTSCASTRSRAVLEHQRHPVHPHARLIGAERLRRRRAGSRCPRPARSA